MGHTSEGVLTVPGTWKLEATGTADRKSILNT